MAKVKFSRTEDTDITSIPITDGQLIYTKSGKCYLDYGEERIEIVTGGDTVPIGFIATFAEVDEYSTLMEDWILCDGRELSRSEYSALYSVIGTKYGAGDGVSTFNVPKIDGRNLVGLDLNDEDFNEVGKIGGSKTHTQTENEVARHRHIVNSSIGAGNPIVPYADGAGNPGGGNTNYTLKMTGVTNDTSPYLRTNYTGNGDPMDIMNPYIVVKFYIKAFRSASVTALVKNTRSRSETDVYSCAYIENYFGQNIIDGTPVPTGRRINTVPEYVLRDTVDLSLMTPTPNGNNKTYTIPSGLTHETLTREVQGYIKLKNLAGQENILGLNMCRFDGTTLTNTSAFAYYQMGTHSIIFETAGTDRNDYTLTYEIYYLQDVE